VTSHRRRTPTNRNSARETRGFVGAARALLRRRVFYNIVASSGEVIITTSASLRGRRPARYSVAKLNKLPQNWSRWPASLRRDAPAVARGDEVELGSLLGGQRAVNFGLDAGVSVFCTYYGGFGPHLTRGSSANLLPKRHIDRLLRFFQNSLVCPTDRHHADHASHHMKSVAMDRIYAMRAIRGRKNLT